MPARKADARWDGTLQDGKGTMRLGGGAWEGPYSFSSRFEDGSGTNPEELIAAAHAGCYSMALSGTLGRNGHEPRSINTTATVTMEKKDDGFAITGVHLDLTAKVPGIDPAKFQELAESAKANCPVSRALAGVPEIELTARLS